MCLGKQAPRMLENNRESMAATLRCLIPATPHLGYLPSVNIQLLDCYNPDKTRSTEEKVPGARIRPSVVSTGPAGRGLPPPLSEYSAIPPNTRKVMTVNSYS